MDFGEDYQEIIDSFMTFLSQVDRYTLGDDLRTLEDFYFGFCDSGLLGAIRDGEDIMQFVSEDYRNEKHILGMINSLSGNERTKGMVDALYNVVLKAAFSGTQNGDSANGGEVLPEIDIQDVKDGLNNIVAIKKDDYSTTEEYREVLSNTIGETINDTIGVELEKETIDEIANYVDENYADQLGELTDEEFNELMFEVVDIYQRYQNGEEINPDDLEDLLPPGNNENNNNNNNNNNENDHDHSNNGGNGNVNYSHNPSHQVFVIDPVAPTCTSDGCTMGVICLTCGETVLEPEIVPASHTYSSDYDNVCDVCGHRR
jgi:hypothetical protein